MAQAKKQSRSGKPRKAATPAEKKAGAQAARRANTRQQGILDDRSRRDIAGVICAVAAIALFIVAYAPADAVVSSHLSSGLHLAFGIGCYIMPICLLLVSIILFIRTEEKALPIRVALGLLLLFLSLLILLALYTPTVTENTLKAMFFEPNVKSQGGYLGAAFAYILYLLLGKAVATVIVIGLIIISLIVVGFSISGIVEKLRNQQKMRAAKRQEEETAPAPAYMPAAYAKGRKNKRGALRGDTNANTAGLEQDAQAAGFSADATQGIDPVIEGATQGLPARRHTAATRRISDMQPDAGNEGAKRPRRATVPMSQRMNTRNLTTVPLDAAEGPKAMTRKLGDKSRRATQAAGLQSSASKRQPVATAVPHPSKDFVLPSMDLLRKSTNAGKDKESEEVLHDTAMLLQETLSDFGVEAQVVGWSAGPTVTLYKVSLPSGVRVSKITNLTDDIALAMASQGVRIFSPIPGTNYVGIEVPNINRRTVLLGDVLPKTKKAPLEVAIGEDVEGNPVVDDLAKMPHLLVAGTTGSGKSVAINGMIMSILMRATPAEVRFIMIDPKRVEFTPYNGIPHLYVPVVADCKEAASALAWGVAEMERRLKVFANVGARNIGQYNAKVQKSNAEAEPDNQDEEMPYIVIVIDELADLMMNVGKEVELSISRIAQLARAAGIHMIIATQRPSTNIVTGLIKANITNRIALSVASGTDSRVILDSVGAQNLIGHGDMLVSKPEYPRPQRFQGCFVSEEEIEAVVEHLKQQGEPEYHSEILKTNIIQMGSTAPDGSGGRGAGNDDPLIWDAAEIVVSSGVGSTSNIQRRLQVGYSRAGRIMDMLEEKGVVGPQNGSKPREVLVDELELETLKVFEANDAN